MEHLEKSWLTPLSGLKKFTSSLFSYSLSKVLDRKKYEVVNESFIDINDPDSEQPDVVIYNREENYKAMMMIEFSDHAGLESSLRTMNRISKEHEIPEAFVYDLDEQQWFSVNNEKTQPASSSKLFGIDLEKILSGSLMRYSGTPAL